MSSARQPLAPVSRNWRHLTFAALALVCHLSGGELDQIQILLGHVSIQTTERYLGCKQKLRIAFTTAWDRAGGLMGYQGGCLTPPWRLARMWILQDRKRTVGVAVLCSFLARWLADSIDY
jgi:hypothetical protein